jgi:hypothetical protein
MFDLASEFISSTRAHIYLSGKAGTGKTTFLKTIVPSCGKLYVVAAPTGVAAINAGGVTLHSLFGLPTKAFIPSADPVDPNLANNTLMMLRHFRYPTQKREMLRELELLVIDEVSMVRMDILDAVDLALRTVRRNPEPFGGVQLLLIGDLYQLAPVVKEDEAGLLGQYYGGRYFFDSHAYKKINPVQLELETVHRQTDRQFVGLLNRIRHAEFDRDDYETLMQYYQPDFEPEKEAGFVTLTTHNATADRMNEEALKKLDGEERYLVAKIIKDFPENLYPTESALRVKIGAQVMFVKNDPSPEKYYFNGKIGVIHAIEESHIEVLFQETGQVIKVKPETWENKRYALSKAGDKLDEEVLGSFVQYPIRLAWAITIHKSQGLTFDKAVIDAGKSFAPGQVYVALSRCRSMEGLVLKSEITSRSIQCDPRIVEFTAVKPGRAALDDRLWQEQQLYVRARLLRVFSFEEPLNQMQAWRDENREYSSALPKEVFEKADNWSAELMGIEEVALRFRSEIMQIFPHDFEDEQQVARLADRITKGADYFAEQLHSRLILPLTELHQSFSVRSRVKKYFEKADTLLERLWFSLNNLYGMRLNGNSLYTGNARITREVKQTGEKPASKTKKAPKGESQEITLQLHREGHSIEDIAQMRGITPGTVESHLGICIAAGKLQVEELLTPEQIHEITAAMEKAEEPSLIAVKSLLDESYSYGMLRWVTQSRIHEKN